MKSIKCVERVSSGKMQGVILAAGRGSRLKPLTNKKPKPLATIGGKTILEYNLDYALQSGITEVTIVVGYRKEQIKEVIGYSYEDISITYVTQDESLGLAHATLQAEDTITDDVFCLFLSDIIYSNPPVDQIRSYLESGSPAVLVDTVDIEDASEYGVCTVENGQVVEVVEKPEHPKSNKIIAGTYILPNTIFDYCKSISPSDRGEYEITDAINEYLQTNSVQFDEISGERVDVAYMEDLFRARLLQQTGTTELSEVSDLNDTTVEI